MKSVIESGLMPPWPYSGGVPLEGDRGLTDDEKRRFLELLSSEQTDDTLKKTANSESPKPLTASPAIEGLGPFGMRRSWAVPAEGGRRWFKGERDKRTFLIPVGNREALRINRVSYRTTAPLAVAAVALSADTTGEARRYIDWDDDPGTYMAGDVGFVAAGRHRSGWRDTGLPKGYHVELPAGADIVSEVHFRPADA